MSVCMYATLFIKLGVVGVGVGGGGGYAVSPGEF